MIYKIGFNPNLYEDIISILQLNCSIDDVKQILDGIEEKSPNKYEKLISFIDRMEFIDHLGYVKNEVIKNKYVLGGKEVKGIDNDIDALRLYLTLTCIDIFASTQIYKTFDQWLLLNCDDFLSAVDIKQYITKKAAEYNNSYGISSNFEKAFINSSEKLKTNLISNLTVLETDKKTNDLQSIIRFLKSVRNKYTHEGKRVYYSSSCIAAPSAVVIGVRLKKVNGKIKIENRSSTLVINKEFDLIFALKEMAIEQCKRAFKFTL